MQDSRSALLFVMYRSDWPGSSVPIANAFSAEHHVITILFLTGRGVVQCILHDVLGTTGRALASAYCRFRGDISYGNVYSFLPG